MWLKKIVFFLNMNQRIELFFVWLQELNHFFKMTQKNEPFYIWPKEIELFCWMWLKNWTFRKIWFTELNPSFNETHRIETLFSKWLTELNPSFQHDSKNWTLLFNMTLRIEPFCSTWLKELNPSFSTWLIEFEPFLQHWLIEIEPTFWTWLHELNHFCFKKYYSKNWTHFTIWHKELNPFLHMSQMNLIFFSKILKELNFFEYDSKIWTFFNVIQIIEPYF